MATRNIVPRATGEGSIGTSAKTWGAVYTEDLSVTNAITGIASGNLPLTGGTMTGKLNFNAGNNSSIVNSATDSRVTIGGGNAYDTGAFIWLYGKDHSNAGSFDIDANDGTTYKRLHGTADGTLSWNGKEVERVNASDTNYIRYESGLQICWENLASSNPPAAMSFPVPFSSAPIVIIVPSSSVNTTGYTSKVANVVSTGFTPVFTVAGGGTYASPNYRYIAIGFWK